MILLLALSILLVGCSKDASKQMISDEMNKLLEADEGMEVQIVYLDKDSIGVQIDVLNRACNDTIEEKGYYKIRKRIIEEDTSTLYYVDAETNEVVCRINAKVKQVPVEKETEEEPEPVEEPEDNFNKTINLEKAKNLLLSYVKFENSQLSSKEKNEFEDISTGDEVEVEFKVYPRMEFSGLKARFSLVYGNGTLIREKVIKMSGIEVNESTEKKFYMELPEGTEEDYVVIFEAYDNDNMIIYKEYEIEVQAKASNVRISDVDPSPEGSIDVGKVLSINVKVKNSGNKDEDDLNLTAEINELDLSDSISIEEIKDDETETFELFFRIPSDTDGDKYRVDIFLYNSDGVKVDEEDFRIEVED